LKNPFFRAIGISFFWTFCNISPTFAERNPSDTSRNLLIASLEKTDKKTERLVVIRPANIVYPEILSGNETASIDYVEQFSTKRKAYLIRTYNRSKKLFPQAEAILKKYNVPKEFKVLLALESGFNGNAVSSAGAVGYWQIMDEVAKEYGLKIPQKSIKEDKKALKASKKKALVKKEPVDERKNFNKSTHVAARYLKDRSRNLDGDWLLIAASYNCGVGNVWNAMERSRKKSPTFWDIKNYLPAETRAYVMNFITLNVIFNNYEAFTKNTLCFKDVTCKIEEPEEMQEENAAAIITE
jgi:soluble lytic murein transglycosylase-like protein